MGSRPEANSNQIAAQGLWKEDVRKKASIRLLAMTEFKTKQNTHRGCNKNSERKKGNSSGRKLYNKGDEIILSVSKS